MCARKASAAVVLTCILCGVAFAGQLPDLKREWISPSILVRSDGKIYILNRADSTEGNFLELYDPKSGSIDLAQRPPINNSFSSGTTDQVVVSGDRMVVCLFASCQIYEPSTNTWRAQVISGGAGASWIPLLTGKILRAGGYRGFFAEHESYLIDPTTLTATATGNLNDSRDSAATVRLRDGRVFAAGGQNYGISVVFPVPTAEIYEPGKEVWTKVATPSQLLYASAGYLLPDGRALVVMGSVMLAYDPGTNQWSALARRPLNLSNWRYFPNGVFLVSGGADEGIVRNSTSFYDPIGGTSRDGRPMLVPRRQHATVLLPDGGVLAFGGLAADGTPTKSVEQIYYGESQMTATLDPGFYVVSTTQDQWSTNGLWGVDVQNTSGFEGGWHFGGLLPASGKDVGFASFSLAAPATVTANVNLQALPGPSGPLEFTLQLLDANKKLVAGPVTGLANLQWSQALQPGYYIVEVRSSSRAPAAAFQMSLLAPRLAPGASGGAVLDRAAGVAGFVGFYLATRQDVQIKLYNENTYGRPRGVGEVTLTLYDAVGRRLQAVGPDAP